MSEYIKTKIIQGKYKDAELMCKDMTDNDIKDMLMEMAYETENLSIYNFVMYMIQNYKQEYWIELALNIMLNPLAFLEGAYSIALFHARELLMIRKSVENLERMLFFYNIPEKLVDEEEARYISEELLRLEPDNKIVIEMNLL